MPTPIEWSSPRSPRPLVPIAIGVAILRHRLYELDRIISRTVGWAVLTGLLVAVFLGAAFLLQAVLAQFTNDNTIAIAGSTLVAFALAQPLRRRVQRAVDRRFDRARYDGQQTLEAFAEHVRSSVDLGTLSAMLATTAGEAVRPAGSVVSLNRRPADEVAPRRSRRIRVVSLTGAALVAVNGRSLFGDFNLDWSSSARSTRP